MPREKPEKKVLGIDPGSRFCGYGVVSSGGASLKYLGSGRIVLSDGAHLHIRLRELFEGLNSVIDDFDPDVAVIEKVFFAKSVRAALSLGHARGIALLSASHRGLQVREYSPLEVKKAVTGYGRAEKEQVLEMIKKILNVKTGLSHDSADALALAVCHINTGEGYE